MIFLVQKGGGAIGIYAFVRRVAFLWNDNALVVKPDPASAELIEALTSARSSRTEMHPPSGGIY